MPAESALTHLQDRLLRVVELVQALQSENTRLKQEFQQLRQELEELKNADQAKSDLLERLQNDRLNIRSRVERIVRNLAALEEPTRG